MSSGDVGRVGASMSKSTFMLCGLVATWTRGECTAPPTAWVYMLFLPDSVVRVLKFVLLLKVPLLLLLLLLLLRTLLLLVVAPATLSTLPLLLWLNVPSLPSPAFCITSYTGLDLVRRRSYGKSVGRSRSSALFLPRT